MIPRPSRPRSVPPVPRPAVAVLGLALAVAAQSPPVSPGVPRPGALSPGPVDGSEQAPAPWLPAWIADAGAPAGLAAGNGVLGLVP